MRPQSFLALASITLSLGLAPARAADNTLTTAEKAAGWKLPFDGESLSGWSNFKTTDIKPGWEVKEGLLVCVDPHNAGDIVSAEKFGAFELQIDFKMAKGANSGIIYHVSDVGILKSEP